MSNEEQNGNIAKPMLNTVLIMTQDLKKGDVLYYQGIGWGAETHVFNIIEENGKKIVHSNNGVKRDYEKVIANTCDLYTSKEEINKKLAQSWRASLIP